ncbi:MAG: cytochrome c5 family protein [Pseudomonadales bacterium]|nr:cytochrome c5 family protein [Halioglobus sp.]MCP5130973.1 cytochrome c5 family protein [Pseudomonadales bacterium]
MAALAGCGEGPSAPPDAEAASRNLQPADPALAAIYQRSCASCHTVAATGAPLTGDEGAWSPRMDKGMDTLLDSVVNGFGGMPPFGLCMDCDAAQFEALILFMASGEPNGA